MEIFEEKMDAKTLKNLLNNNRMATVDEAFGHRPGQWWLLHDNDKKFHSGLVRGWRFSHGIPVMDFPPYSPDLNPIEHLWAYLKKQIRKRKWKDIEQLREVVMDEWNKIPVELCQKLVLSMKRRCVMTMVANGYKTRY